MNRNPLTDRGIRIISITIRSIPIAHMIAGVAMLDLTGAFCTKWKARQSTWRKSWSCRSRGTKQSRS
jgi:hypothetical protein